MRHFVVRFWSQAVLTGVFAVVSSSLGRSAGLPLGKHVEFNRDVRPILSDNCFACHGFDAKKRKADLRLDVAEGAFKGGKSGKTAIKPGDPAGSEVWRRLTTSDEDDKMPPPETHQHLTDQQKDILRIWISQGARYQRHWAFEPPVRPVPPDTWAATPVRNPIDRFIFARLARENLAPSPEANRETLIRRVTFDLTGLPPTPGEVDAFLADTTSEAYERWVARLLNSMHYGEEMARHWLDLARYGDTHGLHLDNERSMWPYRDWVVRAFNQNLPFDAFTIDQIAGDLLPDATQDQRIATGFSRNNVTSGEGGSIDAELLYRYAVDRTATVVETWMALTAGCAVCHDHKFDPISTREFYSLYAFFNSASDPAMDGNIQNTPPILKLKTPADERRLKQFSCDLEAVEAKIPAALLQVDFSDPALLSLPPPPREVENVWMDETIPPGWKITASPGAPTEFVTNGPVRPASGNRALRRQDAGLAQDVVETASSPLEVPKAGRLFAYVYLDPAQLPKAVMLQYRTDEWKHRAVWGDYNAIDWGAAGTTERVNMGALPATGGWARLEFDAGEIGLKPGDSINGFALTQFGGTVYWDKVGVKGLIDPATDPSRSFVVWVRQFEGKTTNDLPNEIREITRETTVEGRSEAQTRQLRDHFISRVCADTRPLFAPLLGAIAAVRKERDDYEGAIPATLVWHDQEKPRESFVMMRGAYDRPGEPVKPGVPAFLPPLNGAHDPTRLDFARWLVSPGQPLTARVAVNRLWQQFFGTGLVKTSGDFGSQGEPPSHPELLDWLAVTFVDSGWDVKAMVRLIVTSATYRQSSRVTPELLQRDPENRWLARGPRFRLDAEQIRDNALMVSGLLVTDMGGKGVKPYQPPNIWEPVGFVGSNTREYRQDSGSALYRRSLYTFYKRTAPPPFMASFDAPNREQFCTRREHSDTPLQALQLMNDIQHIEAARGLAERMLVEGGPTPRDRIEFAYRTLLARRPTDEEIRIVQRALSRHLARYGSDPDAARAVIGVGASQPAPLLPAPELAAYTLTANLLLNLDETLSRN